MSDDVFAPTGDEGTSALEGLVGEGKKFTTVEDLAKGKLESDAFIEKLKGENAEALEALKAAEGAAQDGATVSDLLKQLKDAQEQAAKAGEPAPSKDDLEKLVRDIVRGDTVKQTAEQNRAEANKLVLEKVGGDAVAAKTYLADRAKALNLTVEKLAELSESSVDAFAELLGIKRTQTVQQRGVADLKGSGDGEGLAPTRVMEVDGYHTKAYFDKLKKDMGVAAYLGNHKIQNEYLKAAMALGDERFNQ
jgi:type II secretory pathway component PulM